MSTTPYVSMTIIVSPEVIAAATARSQTLAANPEFRVPEKRIHCFEFAGHNIGITFQDLAAVEATIAKLQALVDAERADQFEPEDRSDEPCPCGDADCNRAFGHADAAFDAEVQS